MSFDLLTLRCVMPHRCTPQPQSKVNLMRVLFSMRAACITGLLACAFAATVVNAQSAAPTAAPHAGEHPPPDRNPAPLTAEQVAKVKAVLAAYKPAALKADDAKAIKRALRDAGLRHNAALDKAITEAGFSPQKLEELDPRPARPPGESRTPGDSPPPPPPPTKPTEGAARKP